MNKKGITKEVTNDHELYQLLLQHRSNYVRLKTVDYSQMELKQLKFIPPNEYQEFFINDYNIMREQMIYGETPDFRKIISGLLNLKEMIDLN